VLLRQLPTCCGAQVARAGPVDFAAWLGLVVPRQISTTILGKICYRFDVHFEPEKSQPMQTM
jgi:hypothetical protein